MSRPSINIPDLEEFPRVRWSPKSHRLEYHSLVFAQPGQYGFVGLREIRDCDSILLSPKERDEMKQIHKLNEIANDLDLHERLVESIKKRSHGRKQGKKKHSDSSMSSPCGDDFSYRPRTRSFQSNSSRSMHMRRRSLNQP